MMAKRKAGRRPEWPKIRERKNREGAGTSWRVDGGVRDGKRRVKQFRSLADAERYAAELRAERDVVSEVKKIERGNRAVSLANLTDEQRIDILEAFRMLEGTAGSLAGSVEFWKAHAAPRNAKSCEEVFEELLQSARMANRRGRTVQELRLKLGPFCAKFGRQAIASVTTADLVQWLDKKTGRLSPRSRAAYRQSLNRLFSFAVSRGYREANPVSPIEKPSCDELVPEIHAPREVRKILQTALSLHPGMVPYLAIGYFAGLRTENELGRLDWGKIDFNDRMIEVTAASAKKRRARFVEMSDNLVAWLMPYRQKPGTPLAYSRRHHRKIIESAGIKWPRNVMRHSFASYHLAAHGDASRTATALGHPHGVETLFTHYRRLVRPAAAKEYWAITPGNPSAMNTLAQRACG